MARSKDLVKREELLEAAAEELARAGVVGTSLRTLATRMDTTARMLVYYFESRENLILEVLEREQKSHGVGATHPSSFDELRKRMLTDWDAMVLGEKARGVRILVQVFGSSCASESLLRSYSKETLSALVTTLEGALIHLGVPSAEARVRSEVFIAAIQGLIMMVCTSSDIASPRSSYKRLVDWVACPE